MAPSTIFVELQPPWPCRFAHQTATIVPTDIKPPRFVRHGADERTLDPPFLPSLEARLGRVVLIEMWLRHARPRMSHMGRHCARFCEVQGAHLHGKMAGDPRKRAGSVRVQKPYQLHEQTDQLSLLQIIPMSHFDRSGLSKSGDKWDIYPHLSPNNHVALD
jgi:hypothetical protein